MTPSEMGLVGICRLTSLPVSDNAVSTLRKSQLAFVRKNCLQIFLQNRCRRHHDVSASIVKLNVVRVSLARRRQVVTQDRFSGV